MNAALLTIQVRAEQDIVPARQRARQLAEMFGINSHQQTALATAVSEIARNAIMYSGGSAKVEYIVRDLPRGPVLQVVVTDSGKGIGHLQEVLDGRYQSRTGMGLGIIGSRRLCEEFEIESKAGGGTRVELGMYLPAPASAEQIATISAAMVQQQPPLPTVELQAQNRELMTTLHTLQMRQSEVERLNAELSETNRGVLALYAELDEQAAILKRANEYKTRFLSDMTHELRTPLNAMISLSRILLDRTDGDLTAEQHKQVSLIHRSAVSLGEMVNDLLDLAKIEAGKTDVHADSFTVRDLLAALRGMFRPLFASSAVVLQIDEPAEELVMHSDEAKVAQILRNLVSNAMKFTETGEVHVSVWKVDTDHIAIIVRDTGIGIAPENMRMVFQDYSQIDSVVQRRQKGTGLGLPLSKRLAELLGGAISVDSAIGKGSTFTLQMPIRYDSASNATAGEISPGISPPERPNG